jgi:aspartate carbamoyltransferase regulatory subunit
MAQYVDNTNSVNPIINGTVIDHLQDGSADEAEHQLKLPDRKRNGLFNTYITASGLDSHKMTSKDIIKIYGFQLPEDEARDFLNNYPTATVNIIERRELQDTRYKDKFVKTKKSIVIHKWRNKDGQFIDLKAGEDIGQPID